jgi:hypothetical protein
LPLKRSREDFGSRLAPGHRPASVHSLGKPPTIFSN